MSLINDIIAVDPTLTAKDIARVFKHQEVQGNRRRAATQSMLDQIVMHFGLDDVGRLMFDHVVRFGGPCDDYNDKTDEQFDETTFAFLVQADRNWKDATPRKLFEWRLQARRSFDKMIERGLIRHAGRRHDQSFHNLLASLIASDRGDWLSVAQECGIDGENPEVDSYELTPETLLELETIKRPLPTDRQFDDLDLWNRVATALEHVQTANDMDYPDLDATSG